EGDAGGDPSEEVGLLRWLLPVWRESIPEEEKSFRSFPDHRKRLLGVLSPLLRPSRHVLGSHVCSCCSVAFHSSLVFLPLWFLFPLPCVCRGPPVFLGHLLSLSFVKNEFSLWKGYLGR